MRASTVSKLAALAAPLAIGGFVAMGFTRLAVGYEIARSVAAPLFLSGFGLAAALFVVAVLWKLGVVEIDD